MTAIFAKTRKGQEEIEHRSAGLSPRARRLLILFDGKRPVDEVRALMPDPQLDETLALLLQDGFIEQIGGATATPAAPPDGGDATVQVPAKPVDPKQLEMARNFMLNSLRTFNGPYGNIDLMTRINDSRSASELHALVDDWFESISLTKMGKMRAVELKGKLLAVL
ncbi:MAG TPA: hypothetical protein PKM39_00330 [Pseudothauera hydrothermalis]|uniref:hypothetical protein n=1 Tax=Pseudothauera hydrothermalis TaxID=2184083 RepID=UPI000C7C240B|nr:hypothetical protein [Pseudothauera hydrothermalis]AUM00060.1 hypothetical protein B4966_07715 [Rhodocyclaceae bacterium]HNQ75058.1 hypothetical protein [Pseudothauera hydrothermalis]